MIAEHEQEQEAQPRPEPSPDDSLAALYDDESEAETVVMPDAKAQCRAARGDSVGSLRSTVEAMHIVRGASSSLSAATRSHSQLHTRASLSTLHASDGVMTAPPVHATQPSDAMERHASDAAAASAVMAAAAARTATAAAAAATAAATVALVAAARVAEGSRPGRLKRKSAQQADFLLHTSSCRDTPHAKKRQTQAVPYYRVDRIVEEGALPTRAGKQYLVHWKGYPVSERTWEPAGAVSHTQAYADWCARRAHADSDSFACKE